MRWPVHGSRGDAMHWWQRWLRRGAGDVVDREKYKLEEYDREMRRIRALLHGMKNEVALLVRNTREKRQHEHGRGDG